MDDYKGLTSKTYLSERLEQAIGKVAKIGIKAKVMI